MLDYLQCISNIYIVLLYTNCVSWIIVWYYICSWKSMCTAGIWVVQPGVWGEWHCPLWLPLLLPLWVLLAEGWIHLPGQWWALSPHTMYTGMGVKMVDHLMYFSQCQARAHCVCENICVQSAATTTVHAPQCAPALICHWCIRNWTDLARFCSLTQNQLQHEARLP